MRRNGDLYEDMIIDRTTYKARIAQLETALASLQPPKGASVVEAAEYLLENLGPFWNNATNEEKNEMLLRIFDRIYVDIETKRIHSLVSKEEFAMPFRAMAERDDVKLEEIAQQDSRELVDRRGFTYQLPTNPLKLVFSRDLLLTEIPARMKEHRYGRSMTQADLGAHFGVSAGTIAYWEQGHSPSIELFEIVAQWFDEDSPDWAIAQEDIPGIGRRIKDHRRNWDMTQTELGAHLGVSASTILSWEQGRAPSLHMRKALAEWLAERAPARRVKRANSDFGARLQKKRMMIGMSQTALGKHLGVDKAQIRRWESFQSFPSKGYAEMTEDWLNERDDYILANRIRDTRVSLALTQRDVASSLGVSLFTLKNWENLRSFPSKTNLSRVITWLSKPHIQRKPERQPEFNLFVLPMKARRQTLGIRTTTLASELGVGRNRVFEWEAARSIPSQEACQKIFTWLQAA